MHSTNDNLSNLLLAVQDTLRKIDRLNSTVQFIRQQTPDDTLTLDGFLHYKRQLTKDLLELLDNTFHLDLKLEAMAA